MNCLTIVSMTVFKIMTSREKLVVILYNRVMKRVSNILNRCDRKYKTRSIDFFLSGSSTGPMTPEISYFVYSNHFGWKLAQEQLRVSEEQCI